MKKVLIFITLLLIGGVAFSETTTDYPFGIRSEMTMEELKQEVGQENIVSYENYYVLKKLPKDHPYFKYALVFYDEEYGIVKFTALGNPKYSNASGDQLKEHFEQISKSIESKYFYGKNHSFIKHKSKLTKKKDYMLSLLKEERVVKKIWNEYMDDGDLELVELWAAAREEDKYTLFINYQFKNFDKYYTKHLKEENPF